MNDSIKTENGHPRCAVDAGFGEVCCDCASALTPDRYFKWLRDSDRKPLCDKCSATYDPRKTEPRLSALCSGRWFGLLERALLLARPREESNRRLQNRDASPRGNAIFNKLNEAYHCGMQTDQGRNALFDAQALADVIVRSESATSLIGPNAKGEPTAMTPGSAN